MSWEIKGGLNVRAKATEAIDNLTWLTDNHWMLNTEEIYRIDAIKNASEWKVKAFDWLAQKRAKYDSHYAEVKSLQGRMAQTAKQISDIEANKALKKLNRDESLLEENARLKDELYWLHTELSGLKQTAKCKEAAKR